MIGEVIVGEGINGYGKIFEDHQNIPHRACVGPLCSKRIFCYRYGVWIYNFLVPSMIKKYPVAQEAHSMCVVTKVLHLKLGRTGRICSLLRARTNAQLLCENCLALDLLHGCLKLWLHFQVEKNGIVHLWEISVRFGPCLRQSSCEDIQVYSWVHPHMHTVH